MKNCVLAECMKWFTICGRGTGHSVATMATVPIVSVQKLTPKLHLFSEDRKETYI